MFDENLYFENRARSRWQAGPFYLAWNGRPLKDYNGRPVQFSSREQAIAWCERRGIDWSHYTPVDGYGQPIGERL